MRNLLGLILCGGESRRMGRDKGLMLKEGIPWARYMAGKLIPWPMPIAFSINPSQLAAYSAILPASELVVDSLSLSSTWGPLKGLLSVHQQFPDKDILLLACDMLDLEEGTIRQLIACYAASARGGGTAGPSGDFFVYRQGDFFQPFCGIYASAGLAGPHILALEGQLTDYSLQTLLKKGRTVSLPMDRLGSFKNYNTL